MALRPRRKRPAPAAAEVEPVKTAPAVARKRRTPPPAKPESEVIPTVTVEPTPDTPVKTYTYPLVDSGRIDYDGIIARYKSKAKSPKTAIRSHCVDCMGGMIAEVDRCSARDCSLHPFRKGENPFHKLSKHNRDKED